MRFLLLPRKRIAKALQEGQADILCYLWTEPVFTAEEVLVTDAGQPRPNSIADLRGQPIGTIAEYGNQSGKAGTWPCPPYFETRCAVSRRGQLTLAEANRAITAAARDGTLARIVAQFR